MNKKAGEDPKGKREIGRPVLHSTAGDERRIPRDESSGGRPTSDEREGRSGMPARPDDTSQDELVCVGRIVKVRGAHGELEVDLLGKTVLNLEDPLTVYLEEFEGADPKRFAVEGRKRLGRRLALKLRDVDAPETAGKLVGFAVMVRAERLPPLPEGQYYHYQIVGLEVVDGAGKRLGRVDEILETGGNDVYVVLDGENEILIPAVENVIVQVDLDEGRMIVELPAGLVD